MTATIHPGLQRIRSIREQVEKLVPDAICDTMFTGDVIYSVTGFRILNPNGRVLGSSTLAEGVDLAYLRARNREWPHHQVVCRCGKKYDMADQAKTSRWDGHNAYCKVWKCPACKVEADTRTFCSQPFSYDHEGAHYLIELLHLHPAADLTQVDERNWQLFIDGKPQGVPQLSKVDAARAYMMRKAH